jgi:FkbM family methyltransferase
VRNVTGSQADCLVSNLFSQYLQRESSPNLLGPRLLPADQETVRSHLRRCRYGEDRKLLPTLLAAAGSGPGTFVELGALDGIHYSNTALLDRCFDWTGLLIEPNPTNFAALKLMRRRFPRRGAVATHSAVCRADGPRWLNVTRNGGAVAGMPASATVRKFCSPYPRCKKLVEVPCSPLSQLMSDAGLRDGATFLSLDVEGAEAIVLETVDPAAFKVILVELDGVDEAKDARVHQMLTRAGMTRLPGTALLGKKDKSAVFMRSGTAAHPPLHLRRRGSRCVSMQPPGLRTSLFIDVC